MNRASNFWAGGVQPQAHDLPKMLKVEFCIGWREDLDDFYGSLMILRVCDSATFETSSPGFQT